MQILNSTYKPTFTSRLNPIKPFRIQTQLGDLWCTEIPTGYLLKKRRLMDKIADFFCKNFATSTKEPYWYAYNAKRNQLRIRNGFIEFTNEKMSLDDGNFTMLVAHDKKGKLRGACMSYGFEEIPHVRDKVIYIDSIAVDNKFRKCGVGKILLDKSLEINKTSFTDAFLKGEVNSTKFYQKQGFRQMNPNSPDERLAVKSIANYADGDGYPDYFQFFTKQLQPTAQRWYEFFNQLKTQLR